MVPFVGSEAVATGLVNPYQLATRYDSVFRNVYVPREHAVTAVDKAVAAYLWSDRKATLAGLSAAAVLGSKWIDGRLPAELNQRHRHKTRGILLHSDRLDEDETCLVEGIRVTTPARTAYDLGRRGGLVTAVIRIDALMQATGVKPADVELAAQRHRGARGIVQLRQAIALSDTGSESPQETRTRLLLTDAGLRPRRTQINVFDDFGEFVGRIDMGWDDWRVGVEYDGVQHWADPDVRMKDIEKQVAYEALGWRIIRVNNELLRHRPQVVVSRVRAALRAAGAPV